MIAGGRQVSTTRMAERLGVSPMTIRRDLKALEDAGVAVRSYGGAVGAQRITFEFAFDERRRRRLREKRRIGKAAAAFVQPGQTVFLDTGTTTLEIARSLARSDVPCMVATSSLVIAGELWGRPGCELLLLGGRVREGSPDLVGPATELMLDRLTADLAFVGSEGVDPARGSFAADLETAQVAGRMARNAARTVVVADDSKLGRPGPVLYLPVADMTELITTRGADLSVVRRLRRRGVKVHLT